MLRHAPITVFEISVTNADGTRRSDAAPIDEEEEGATKKKKKVNKAQGGKSNAAKIQFFLDQRKPPTEKLQSLCAEYDDDLNRIVAETEA